MREKLNIVLAVISLLICLTACNNEDVKYISSDADEVDVGIFDTAAAEECSDPGFTEYNSSGALEEAYQTYESESDIETLAQSLVPVYVCGAVLNPGVYYMSPDALKEEALAAAGGFDLEAAIDYINLAETVQAGEKIYFPYLYELKEGYNMNSGEEGHEDSRKVNINTATKEELMTLPGIGESKAQAIIKYRDNNGPFQNIQDITSIPGIKDGVYNNIKDHIVVN